MFTTIYSGMDVEPFLDPPRSREEVRAELGFQDDDIVVGKVARLFNLKGHRYLLEAASQIIEKCPRARFLLVGDGPLRDQFEARISRDGLADHFVLAGLVPPGRIPELLHATDLVVHASVWEGLARVLPQSMIAGKPVVSFEIDGAPEVVLHEETGLLVQPESVEGLIESVTRLASDQELRDRMGNAGCRRWTETFRYQEMARLVREVYQDVLD
jgi:glycosyltransferase involved in cell wall biosynthesis